MELVLIVRMASLCLEKEMDVSNQLTIASLIRQPTSKVLMETGSAPDVTLE